MSPMLRRLAVVACIGARVEAAFKIYDAYSPVELQAAHGISSTCSDALYVPKNTDSCGALTLRDRNMTISCDESNMSRAAEGVDMDCKFQNHPEMLSVRADRSDRLVHGKHHSPVHGVVLEFIANLAFNS
jgi:hypothetical protein